MILTVEVFGGVRLKKVSIYSIVAQAFAILLFLFQIWMITISSDAIHV